MGRECGIGMNGSQFPRGNPWMGCIIGSDVTCGACIIDEQRVEDRRFRPVQDMWNSGMWAAYIA